MKATYEGGACVNVVVWTENVPEGAAMPDWKDDNCDPLKLKEVVEKFGDEGDWGNAREYRPFMSWSKRFIPAVPI